MIAATVLMELERLASSRWTGKVAVNFKDGHASIEVAKVARGEKRRR